MKLPDLSLINAMRNANELLDAMLNEENISTPELIAIREYLAWGPEEPPQQHPLLLRRHGLSRN